MNPDEQRAREMGFEFGTESDTEYVTRDELESEVERLTGIVNSLAEAVEANGERLSMVEEDDIDSEEIALVLGEVLDDYNPTRDSSVFDKSDSGDFPTFR